MSHPFPTTAERQQLRRLTAKGKATYQELNDRDETKLAELRQVRADLMAEVASIDDVMEDLRDTISRRLAKMRGDVISLLPTDPHLAEFASVPDLSPNPAKNVERLAELHDAQDAREGVVEL